jgi:hypothetical protein
VKITKPTPGGVLLAGALLALSLGLVPGALAGKATSACLQAAPTVAIDNTYAWAAWGSWGLPGQPLKYAVKVTNNDSGCSASSFAVSVSAPTGFSVSLPTSSISLQAKSIGYVWANIASPAGVADGDYPLNATVSRAGATSSAPQVSASSYYKVYSSDTSPPSLFWPSPGDGSTISGKSYNVGVMSNDDHEVQKVELYIDGALTTTTMCADISYNCQLVYTWRISRVHGQHTVRFAAYDWLVNESSSTQTYTVN